MKVDDATGTGNQAKVDGRNRLHVNSISQTTEHFATTIGQSWNIVVQQTPTAACDVFFYFKNTGTLQLIFEGFSSRVASAEIIEIKIRDTGTPVGGSCVTAINLNTGAVKDPVATILAGNDITGLSGGSVIERIYKVNAATEDFNFAQDVVVDPGGTFTMNIVTGAILVDVTLNLFENGFG